MFSSATKDPFKKNQYQSVSIGLLITKQLKGKINFLNDPKIKTIDVRIICARCIIKNCKERLVFSIILEL